ncbi:MAG TPA: hybrid sensor histidine kinase/response regulator [Oculatellaceae cyanobacterium]|jgi:two-component system chemotaxis sensor kinase CheA
MMIEDEELRNLFKISSEEHIQNLETGLLHLEKNPNDTAKLQELLREAHTLKGDARMLGVKDVETLTHQIEHILGTIKQTPLSSDSGDRIYQGLDAIRKLVHESVTGEPANVKTFQVLAHLMGAKTEPPVSQPEPETAVVVNATESVPEIELTPTVVEEIAAEVAELESKITAEINQNEQILVEPETPELLNLPVISLASGVTTNGSNGHSINITPEIAKSNGNSIPLESDRTLPALATVAPAANNNYRIDTIRVETKNLDALMTQAGELTVTKIRIAHQLTDMEELVNLWEEWSRENSINRFNFDSEAKFKTINHSSIKQLNNFQNRSTEKLEKLGALVNRLKTSASEDVSRLETISGELEEGIRTLRLLPLSTIFNLFPRLVRDLARQQGKQVELVIEGGETKADKRILEEMKDPLMHMIRNCIDHGIETPEERQSLGKPPTATLRLTGYQSGSNIIIEIGDDGRGLDIEKIQQTAIKRGICSEDEITSMTPRQIQSLIFAPGFSTRTIVTDISGRGVGLDVVRTNVERLKGTIQVLSNPGQGCTFRLQLGTTLTTAHVLILDVAGISYALPVEFVQTTLLVAQDDIFSIEGRETIIFEEQPVSVVTLAELLELNYLATGTNNAKTLPCIILQVGEERLGLLVDALLDEQDVILKPQSKLLKRVRNIMGATILGTGEVCMVLNPLDLRKSLRRNGGRSGFSLTETSNISVADAKRKPVVLLAEDSIAIRTQEKRILESAGYEVITAVDGLDGFNKLKTRNFDVVVSDVQMPNMDGLTLASKIRQNKQYNELPIILVTSLASEEDKRRGAEAGANAYITKGNFNQEVLLETLKRLV